MGKEQPVENQNETPSLETDWESRTLCSDGNCIGVIGSDGRCKECGKPYDGRAIEGEVFEDDTYDYDEDYDDDYDEEEGPLEDSDTPDNLDWKNRQLCSDGNCIGIIGPDGRCKECGKPFKG